MGTTDAGEAAWTSLILLERFREGDEGAAEAIFARYFDRLTALARARLSARLARRADPEDIALSAYRSFFVEARAGRFVLGRGGDLWRLLAAIAGHKLLKRARHEGAARRSMAAEVSLEGAAGAPSAGPTAEEAVALADEVERALGLLDPFAGRVLELRLRGLALAEIAAEAGRSERSVRRALARIREALAGRLGDA